MSLENLQLDKLLGPLQENLSGVLPNILKVVVILVIGWLIAVIVRAAIRRILSAVGLNKRLSSSTSSSMDVELGVAKGAYWIIILMTLVAVFSNLDLPMVSEPLNALVTQVFEYLPKLISGGVLALVAWVLATVVRSVSTKGINATGLASRLGDEVGQPSLGSNIGNILFWLIILLFLPAILGALQLNGLLEPVKGMVDKILAMIPNILAAGVIGFVGWIVARILRDITANILVTTRLDTFAAKAGMSGGARLSKTLATIVFVLVFVPALIAALNALKIEAISGPAVAMLNKMMAAIPNIISAAVILAITYYVARFVALTLSLMLSGLGIDELPEKLGVVGLNDRYAPSILIGKIVLFFAMLFATVEAANMLGFTQVRDVVTMLIRFGGQILLGSVILAAGFWLSNLTYRAITRMGTSATMANIARFAILGLVTAMGLRAMGLADDIVNLAFGLTLGSVAVAVALAFGLGGREAAGKLAEHWVSKLK
jgi:hypothetical protein